ncbi:hypothetical protein ACP4OV_028757 [Aristida adscensionis]
MATAQRRWTAAAAAAMVVVVSMALASPARSQTTGAPAAAPGPAGGGGIDSACLNSLLNMSDCLPYVQKGSAARRPEAACCPELAGLVGSNPVCLCELLAGAADSYGIAVDYTRALALPGICRVSTPPVSTCAALGYKVHLGPAAAPMAGAPSPASEGPQFPGTSPSASPPASTNRAGRRLAAGHLFALAAAAIGAML